jgi:hypothetical protein
MLRKSIILVVALILGLVSASQVGACDGLNALSGRPAEPTTAPTTLEEFRTLVDAVPKENFREISERVFAFDVKHGGFIFPTVTSRSPSGFYIWNAFRLAPIPKDVSAEVLADRLGKLLAASGERGDVFFSLAPETGMITLHGCIQVQGKVGEQDYIQHLLHMAEVAVETESLWNPELWTADQPKHVGQWEAKDQGMKLVLHGGNRFELVVGGQVTRGVYQMDGDALTMEDANGDKLTGQVHFDNANQFQLIVGENKNLFVRL